MPHKRPGISPNRTWIYAPEPETLKRRWDRLIHAASEEKPILLKECDSRHIHTTVRNYEGLARHTCAIGDETKACPSSVRVAYRSFDR